MLALALDFQMSSGCSVIAVQRMVGCDIRHQALTLV